MEDVYQAYLALLRSLGESMDQLSALAQKKAAAANGDDLMALDEVMKQEQAMTLAFRGMEQTREKLLAQMNCGNVSLSRLPERFPPEMQGAARGRGRFAEAVSELPEGVGGRQSGSGAPPAGDRRHHHRHGRRACAAAGRPRLRAASAAGHPPQHEDGFPRLTQPAGVL